MHSVLHQPHCLGLLRLPPTSPVKTEVILDPVSLLVDGLPRPVDGFPHLGELLAHRSLDHVPTSSGLIEIQNMFDKLEQLLGTRQGPFEARQHQRVQTLGLSLHLSGFLALPSRCHVLVPVSVSSPRLGQLPQCLFCALHESLCLDQTVVQLRQVLQITGSRTRRAGPLPCIHQGLHRSLRSMLAHCRQTVKLRGQTVQVRHLPHVVALDALTEKVIPHKQLHAVESPLDFRHVDQRLSEPSGQPPGSDCCAALVQQAVQRGGGASRFSFPWHDRERRVRSPVEHDVLGDLDRS
mmetsp:Transcript_8258/g.16074  ORF Transcript_8258/g.16074 Transcript_8258/m.16074 type:complete len:294 (-) Transcript_8258:166-1047(-)